MDLNALRAAAASFAGVEQPELEPLRRVTWGSIVRIALIAIVASVLISSFANIGLNQIVEEWRDADWW